MVTYLADLVMQRIASSVVAPGLAQPLIPKTEETDGDVNEETDVPFSSISSIIGVVFLGAAG